MRGLGVRALVTDAKATISVLCRYQAAARDSPELTGSETDFRRWNVAGNGKA